MSREVPRTLFLCWLLLAAAFGAGCQRPPEVRFHGADAYPQRLSEWGLLRRDGDRLVLGRDLVPYEVNTPLFSDYALKLRAYHLPDGGRIRYKEGGSFQFPPGSVIAKTFFYPVSHGVLQAVQGWDGDVSRLDLANHELVETRLLVRQDDGWDALPYVWDGDDAYLSITGALLPRKLALTDGEVTGLPYVVPSRSECAGCHATNHTAGTLDLIGLKARHLNRSYPGTDVNQLTAWSRAGRLEGVPALDAVPRNAAWNDEDEPLEARARAYLDSNCGHCHNAAGAADTSGLLLDASVSSYRRLGVCKSPVAAGRGTGGRPYSIVPGDPDHSILVYRMQTSDPATRMPEAGRAVAHAEGVEVIRRWIAGLPGECL